jgi:hypothetical protein
MRNIKRLFTLGMAWVAAGAVALVFLGCGTLQRPGPAPTPTPSAALKWFWEKPQVEPGRSTALTVQTSLAGPSIELSVFDQKIPLLPSSDTRKELKAWVAIPLDSPAGYHYVTLTAKTEAQEAYRYFIPITIIPRSPFKISRLNITGFSQYRFGPESRVMRRMRSKYDNNPEMPAMPWLWPVIGRVSEIFGSKRIYNNGLKSWYHGGLDIAAPGGTVIRAPAPGRVILVRHFKAHGNTTILDHGFGIHTSYLHQKTIYVHEGQHVASGDPIGEVGTTGSSTGNHLHFQVNIHGVLANPEDFLVELNPASELK